MVDDDRDIAFATDDELAAHLQDALGLQDEVSLRRRLEAAVGSEYEVMEAIGRGSGGIVFKARDLKLDRLVAIKCPWPSDRPELQSAMLREARHLATSSHPNIAAVYAISEKPENPFIVMELVDGLPITQALADRPISQQVRAFVDLLHAVSELHRRSLVHRDLKPDNILVARHGQAKLVDFGIAQGAESHATRIQGTPAYVAPEQSAGQVARPAADVFSLGVVFFELLTGQRPFRGQTEGQLLKAVRENDPPLPRSLRQEIPGALQAIILTALEKDPVLRYPSAREFLLDLERFEHGEAVSATPTLLANVLDHGIERHVNDIHRWQKDRMISPRECDLFLDRYGRLRQREDFWVLDSRRISFSQVMLHLGVWSCAVSASLMLAFPWPQIGVARFLLPALLWLALTSAGTILWRRRTHRVAIVLLMGAALLTPIVVCTVLVYFGWLGAANAAQDLLSGIATNQQLLAATLTSLAFGLLVWRGTRTSAFALISSLSVLAVATAAFGLLGLRSQFNDAHFDRIGGWYLGPGALLLGIAIVWDLRRKLQSFAAPFYVAGTIVVLLSLTAIARFGPTLQWLGFSHPEGDAAISRQIDYGFMINGALYLAIGLLADRSTSSAWLRRIGSLLFWLAPSHLLIPVLRLENDWPLFASAWTLPELLLPIVALAFIFASVPKQMKSFFFSGLFYTAVSVQRLTARHFENKFAWPVALAAAGLTLALIAWRRPALFEGKRDVV